MFCSTALPNNKLFSFLALYVAAVIIFVNLKKSDKMVLQCNASNIYDYVFADFYLNIID